MLFKKNYLKNDIKPLLKYIESNTKLKKKYLYNINKYAIKVYYGIFLLKKKKYIYNIEQYKKLKN
jgi:hypothetical protein